jgi:protein MAK11
VLLSTVAPRPILENPGNRELGTLLHHSSTVTRLAFPTRGKLLSAGEDSTVAVTRTRDWSLLSTIKCPVPKAQGRPSGDTAAHGGTPCGVNDFAIHPSMKLMITVSKGERCMRLWNLVTGKKAGVLNFGREVLAQIGEGKHSTGEGRKVVWGSADGEDEFAVGFDRDVLVFGMDSRPKCRVMSDARTKVHQLCYVSLDGEAAVEETVLAVSTEDGRVLFFSTRTADLGKNSAADARPERLPNARLVAQLGGAAVETAGNDTRRTAPSRIKDFKVLATNSAGEARSWLIVTGSSDGKLRVWSLDSADLRATGKETPGKRVGQLLGTYETQNRIVCVEAFVMIPRPEGADESEFESGIEESEDGDSEEAEE